MIDPRIFAIPDGELQVTPHLGGHINRSWLVTVDGSPTRYLLQRLNEHVFTRPALVMENVARVTAFAAERDARAMRLVPTREGAWWHVDREGGHWRLVVFVEGAATHEAAQSPEQAYEAARAFGAFVQLLGTYNGPRLHETIPGFHDTPARLAALERAVAADRVGRVAESRTEIDAILSRRALGSALVEAQRRGEIVERVVHNDAKLANVLLDARSGRALCVVDLDTVMPGLALYDFGDLVRSIVSGEAEDERDVARIGVREAYYDALATGFTEGAGLTTAERALLRAAAQVITLEQAARFLTDWLDGDRYYHVDASRRAHNLERARAQLALLRGLGSDSGV